MAQVDPAVREVLAAPVALAVREVLVVPEDPVALAVRVVQAALVDLVAREVRVVQEVPEVLAGRTVMRGLVTVRLGAAPFVFRLELSAFPMRLLMVLSALGPQALGLRVRQLFCPRFQR